jgi:hypothetical protein
MSVIDKYTSFIIIQFKCGFISGYYLEKIINPIIIYGNVRFCSIHGWESFKEIGVLEFNKDTTNLEKDKIIKKILFESIEAIKHY